MRIGKLRPTPSALIATIALVFAMTGGAIAATKIQTNDIAKRAVTGSKIARDAVKGGKIANGKVKAKDLAPNVIPDVPTTAYGRVNKNGTNVAPAGNAVGITGVANGGPGVICYDLATPPVSGSATVVTDTDSAGSTVSLLIGSGALGCVAPYNDAQTITTSAPSVSGPNPYEEGSAANRDVYVQFIGG
jgi:hypothetical protein